MKQQNFIRPALHNEIALLFALVCMSTFASASHRNTLFHSLSLAHPPVSVILSAAKVPRGAESEVKLTNFLAGERRSQVATTPPHLKLEAQPPHPVNGAACLFKVTATTKLAELRGKWLDHEVEFESLDQGRTWVSIAGTAFSTTKGQYPFEIEGKTPAGSPVRFSQTIRVAIVKRKIIAAPKPLTVEGRYTSPDPETLKRIGEEKIVKTAAYEKTDPHALWSGLFMLPLDSLITETFGVRRMFNAQLLSEHHGVDFRAAPGTPVLAANSGTVVLARELFYEGNCVILDHGQGLSTIYMHFSKFAVHEGDKIERGQKLGESGATGRVTGPHLHVSVLWRGVALDLLSLTTLKPPTLPHPQE